MSLRFSKITDPEIWPDQKYILYFLFKPFKAKNSEK